MLYGETVEPPWIRQTGSEPVAQNRTFCQSSQVSAMPARPLLIGPTVIRFATTCDEFEASLALVETRWLNGVPSANGRQHAGGQLVPPKPLGSKKLAEPPSHDDGVGDGDGDGDGVGDGVGGG
jgi:hypothetical protein